MKRLKYSCLFYGHLYPPILACFFAPLAGLAVYELIQPKQFAVGTFFAGTAGFLLISCIVLFLITHRLSSTERELIANAELPLWYSISEEDLNSVRASKAMSIRTLILWVIILSSCFAIGLYVFRDDAIMSIICGTTVIACSIAVFLNYCHASFWTQIDNTAVSARIPVHHYFSKTYTGGSRLPRLTKSYSEYYQQEKMKRITRYYLVFYLPDGKYVLHNSAGIHNPEAIRVIKFKGQVKWFPEINTETDKSHSALQIKIKGEF